MSKQKKVDLADYLAKRRGAGGRCRICSHPQVRQQINEWVDEAISKGLDLTRSALSDLLRTHHAFKIAACSIARHMRMCEPERNGKLWPNGR